MVAIWENTEFHHHCGLSSYKFHAFTFKTISMKNWTVDDKVIYIKSSSFLTVTDSTSMLEEPELTEYFPATS